MTGIDLARHDRRARLHRGQSDFAKSGARAAVEQAKIVADFRELDRNALQHTREGDEGTHVGSGLDQITSRHQGHAGDAGEPADHDAGIVARRIDAGTYCRAAKIDFPQQGRKLPQAVDVLCHRHGKGLELGAQPHRHGVHELGAANLDDVVELPRLLLEGRDQLFLRAITRAGTSRSMVRRTAVG